MSSETFESCAEYIEFIFHDRQECNRMRIDYCRLGRNDREKAYSHVLALFADMPNKANISAH